MPSFLYINDTKALTIKDNKFRVWTIERRYVGHLIWQNEIFFEPISSQMYTFYHENNNFSNRLLQYKHLRNWIWPSYYPTWTNHESPSVCISVELRQKFNSVKYSPPSQLRPCNLKLKNLFQPTFPQQRLVFTAFTLECPHSVSVDYAFVCIICILRLKWGSLKRQQCYLIKSK